MIKGIASAEDMDTAIKLGADGVIVSNHGRQLDMGQSAISALKDIVLEFKVKYPS